MKSVIIGSEAAMVHDIGLEIKVKSMCCAPVKRGKREKKLKEKNV